MMTRDGRYPPDFQQPKTVEAFKLMDGMCVVIAGSYYLLSPIFSSFHFIVSGLSL